MSHGQDADIKNGVGLLSEPVERGIRVQPLRAATECEFDLVQSPGREECSAVGPSKGKRSPMALLIELTNYLPM